MAPQAPDDRNAMSFPQLVDWAWRETPPVHKHVVNLWIHIFAVPLFVLGHALLVAALFTDLRLLVVAPLCIIVSLALQNFGHSLERERVHPFLGAGDFVRRLYAEQFCNFWRFLVSGGWYASLKAAG
jgi:hypothetical protein